MSEGNIPIDYIFLETIRWQRNQVSKKTDYDKISVITLISFRSTRFIMDFLLFDRKKYMSHVFPFKDTVFYNLLAVIYDKKFLTHVRRSRPTVAHERSQIYHIVKV